MSEVCVFLNHRWTSGKPDTSWANRTIVSAETFCCWRCLMCWVLLAHPHCLSRELKICPMGGSADVILANKDIPTTSFFYMYIFGNQRRCAGQHDTTSQLRSLQNNSPSIFIDSSQGCLSRHKFWCSQTRLDSWDLFQIEVRTSKWYRAIPEHPIIILKVCI